MLLSRTKSSLLQSLITLTCLLIFSQLLFLYVYSLTSNLIDGVISASLTSEIFRMPLFIFGLLKLIASQLIVYAVFVWGIWYLAISAGELFHWRVTYTYILGLLLWLLCVAGVIAANVVYVRYSFFSALVQNNILNNSLSNMQLYYVFLTALSVVLILSVIAVFNLCHSFSLKKNIYRHGLMLAFLFLIACLYVTNIISQEPRTYAASVAKPNIIFIGLDALRPDHVGFYNNNQTDTPNMNAFLKSSVSFTNAYTVLPRTFPSWSTILTGRYPLHTGARGNITELSTLDVTETLPKRLQQDGYETIYETDDTRFNNTNKIFGFDRVITPPMGINDFVLGTANDFPLSNLLVPTFIGRYLFPYNYANHGVANTYDPKNFLSLVQRSLHNRPDKPLFLAVHFTISHWPFYWFNDHQPLGLRELQRYEFGVKAADTQLAAFLNTLKENGLLDHAIVVFLSDHGTSLGLPGDRVTAKAFYQGDKENIKKLPEGKYRNVSGLTSNIAADYGVDTSYGYGGDVLSLKQYHSLLAIKGYGVDVGAPHAVDGRVAFMDIAPTILDLLQQPALASRDGISLKPYLLNSSIVPDNGRPLFLETTFTLEEIEREGISMEKVLEKTIRLIDIDQHTGLIYVKNADEKIMNKQKQLAILQGDWILARYPDSLRRHFEKDANNNMVFKDYTQPPYMVLVNLKTGQWTTEMDTPFAQAAPIAVLLAQLKSFYGSGMGES
jgi:arylsulfatase A-like enzyme